MATQGKQVFMCFIQDNIRFLIFSGHNFLLFRVQDGVCDPPYATATAAQKDPDQTEDDNDLNMKKVQKRSRFFIQNHIRSVMKVNHFAVVVVIVTCSPGGVMRGSEVQRGSAAAGEGGSA